MEVEYGKRKVIFIDENGEDIFMEGIDLHKELAEILLNLHEDLKKEYEESGITDVTDFFVEGKGYIKVSDFGRGLRFATLESKKITDKQKKRISELYEKGYRIDDLSKPERSSDGYDR